MKNIPISGSIVPDDDVWIYNLFGIQCTSPKAVKKELQEANGEEVTIEINSGGGDLFAGNEIYYAIHEYKGQTTADITGLAASAGHSNRMWSKCGPGIPGDAVHDTQRECRSPGRLPCHGPHVRDPAECKQSSDKHLPVKDRDE